LPTKESVEQAGHRSILDWRKQKPGEPTSPGFLLLFQSRLPFVRRFETLIAGRARIAGKLPSYRRHSTIWAGKSNVMKRTLPPPENMLRIWIRQYKI
jgi:hypothetical protein